MKPFADRLLPWFDRHRRDLPWRRTSDPWAIWVSEVMLQQTRVEAVREPFVRFLERFPTPAAFAWASDDELLTAWRGLGYYRRARLLRDGARAVVAAHGGAVPADLDALGELPGIGAYTRGAVASIAFGHAEPAIDGNVERVTARHLGLTDDVGTAPARRADPQHGGRLARPRPPRRLQPGADGARRRRLHADLAVLRTVPGRPGLRGEAARPHRPAAEQEATARGRRGHGPRRAGPSQRGRCSATGCRPASRTPARSTCRAAGRCAVSTPTIWPACCTSASPRACRSVPCSPRAHAITHHRITMHGHAATLLARRARRGPAAVVPARRRRAVDHPGAQAVPQALGADGTTNG
jgi:endonuclease III